MKRYPQRHKPRGSLLPSARRVVDHDELAGLSDVALVQRSRNGDSHSFSELFRRHYRTAVQIAAATTSTSNPDDVAAEAFAKIWNSLKRGGGPEQAFRPYLATTVRNVAINAGTRTKESPLSSEDLQFVMAEQPRQVDSLDSELAEGQLITEAFSRLPDRWRSVLWLTEVEGNDVTEVAHQLGLSPNAASALSLRAREGLRSAWLQVQVEDKGANQECSWTLERLGAHTRRALTAKQSERAGAHLESCADCRRAAARLAHLGTWLKISILVAGSSGSAWVLAAMTAAPAAAAALGQGAAAPAGTANAGVGLGLGQKMLGKAREVVSSLAGTPAVAATVAGVLVSTGLMTALAQSPAGFGSQGDPGSNAQAAILQPVSAGSTAPAEPTSPTTPTDDPESAAPSPSATPAQTSSPEPTPSAAPESSATASSRPTTKPSTATPKPTPTSTSPTTTPTEPTTTCQVFSLPADLAWLGGTASLCTDGTTVWYAYAAEGQETSPTPAQCAVLLPSPTSLPAGTLWACAGGGYVLIPTDQTIPTSPEVPEAPSDVEDPADDPEAPETPSGMVDDPATIAEDDTSGLTEQPDLEDIGSEEPPPAVDSDDQGSDDQGSASSAEEPAAADDGESGSPGSDIAADPPDEPALTGDEETSSSPAAEPEDLG